MKHCVPHIPESVKGCIVSLSGGLDSSVLAYHLVHAGVNVKALSVNYGQKHVKELRSSSMIAAHLNIEHKVVSLGSLMSIFPQASSVLDSTQAVPEGHYADESMKSTVVPNRNMLLISVGLAWSVACKFDGVAYAAHAGDHAIYPDCRPEFADAMDNAARLCDYIPQHVVRPFVEHTKADIVVVGAALGVPFEHTWSCYNGREKHCGKCGTCVERIEAFSLAGVIDPTQYEL